MPTPPRAVPASGDDEPTRSRRNIVICLDGTSNEPEHGSTNVARMYAVATKNDRQLVYYDPGVGTMGARGAVTPLAQKATLLAGLVVGYGVRDHLEDAYRFLMEHYRRGDRILVFGFSRGAYTARALTGMLRTVGLLRPGSQNLVPYAVKLYTRNGKKAPTGPADPGAERAYWRVRREFTDHFGNPDFPNAFDPHHPQIHFLGVWDTVKSIGWLNWKARWQEARWPFTRNIANVATARHAMALDERRRAYGAYRFSGERPDHKEMWFTGVHSDVGGQFADDHRLSDIAFSWMVDEARRAGLEVDETALRRELRGVRADPPPAATSLPRIHRNSWPWFLAGGWRAREIRIDDHLHTSVRERIAATRDDPHPYHPRFPSGWIEPNSP